MSRQWVPSACPGRAAERARLEGQAGTRQLPACQEGSCLPLCQPQRWRPLPASSPGPSLVQLSQEDAAAIATAIRDEIANLTTNLEEQLSLSLEQVGGRAAGGAGGQGGWARNGLRAGGRAGGR